MAQATTEQVIEAYHALTDRDMLILRKMSASLIGGTTYPEPQDLLHEAFTRCLDGRRSWPMHQTSFSVCVGNVMRSISSAEREKAKKKTKWQQVDFDESVDELHGPDAPTASSPEDEALSAEQMRITRKVIDYLRGKLEGDVGAQKILSGIAAGLSPAEVRETFPQGEKAFEAAMQRIRRRGLRAPMH